MVTFYVEQVENEYSILHQTRRKRDDPRFGLFLAQKGKAFGSGSGCHRRDGNKAEEE
jgi:hypothetical protein